MLQLLSNTKSDFHPNFNHPWQYFITSCWQEKVGFWANRWTHLPSMTIFVHLFVEVSSKSYRSDIKYHMTPNIIFSALISETCTILLRLNIREDWNLCWVILNSWIHAHFKKISACSKVLVEGLKISYANTYLSNK